MSNTEVRIIHIGFISMWLVPFLSCRGRKFRLLAQFGPIGTLTTWIRQENRPQTRGFSLPKFTPNHLFFCSNVYLYDFQGVSPRGGWSQKSCVCLRGSWNFWDFIRRSLNGPLHARWKTDGATVFFVRVLTKLVSYRVKTHQYICFYHQNRPTDLFWPGFKPQALLYM